MIVGLDEIPKLSKRSKELIAAFAQGRQFDAVKELVEFELIVKVNEIIDNPATPNDVRLEQIGRKNGIIELLQVVMHIKKEVSEGDNN